MIKKNNKVYRNLQEQVLDNQEAIQYLLNEGGVLNEFGIRVVGKVDSSSQLPSVSSYDGEFGDAFAVGTVTPYELYIWTRAFAGNLQPFWFNIGRFPVPSNIPGPEGKQGEPGKDGQRGNSWQSATSKPTGTSGKLPFDQALDTSTGDVYQFNGSSWSFIGNIRGPQGIQGIQGKTGETGPEGKQGPIGPRGPQGQFITIIGTLTSTEQLPSPTIAERSDAYLIPDATGMEHVWLLVGSGTDLTWHDAGGFGGGIPSSNAPKIVYGTDESGNQTQLKYNSGTTGNALVQRQSNGCITVPSAPQANTDAVSKKYVDDTEDVLQGQIETVESGLKQEIADVKDSIKMPGVFTFEEDGLVPHPTTTIDADMLFLNAKGKWDKVSAEGMEVIEWDITERNFSWYFGNRYTGGTSYIQGATYTMPNLSDDQLQKLYDKNCIIDVKYTRTGSEPYNHIYLNKVYTRTDLKRTYYVGRFCDSPWIDQLFVAQIYLSNPKSIYVQLMPLTDTSLTDTNEDFYAKSGMSIRLINWKPSSFGNNFPLQSEVIDVPVSTIVTPDALVRRGANGDITVLEEPISDTSAVSKAYVDKKAGGGGSSTGHGLYKIQYCEATAPFVESELNFMDTDYQLLLPFTDAIIDHVTFLDYYATKYNMEKYRTIDTTAFTDAEMSKFCMLNPTYDRSSMKINQTSTSNYWPIALCIGTNIANNSGGTYNYRVQILQSSNSAQTSQYTNLAYWKTDTSMSSATYLTKQEYYNDSTSSTQRLIRLVKIL